MVTSTISVWVCLILLRLNVSENLITAIAEKPTSHKYDVANGTRTQRALQPTSGNSARALIQNDMSELGLYMLFKVRTEVRLINFSASRDVNPERHLHYQE